jgi:hypothetical protein
MQAAQPARRVEFVVAALLRVFFITGMLADGLHLWVQPHRIASEGNAYTHRKHKQGDRFYGR